MIYSFADRDRDLADSPEISESLLDISHRYFLSRNVVYLESRVPSPFSNLKTRDRRASGVIYHGRKSFGTISAIGGFRLAVEHDQGPSGSTETNRQCFPDYCFHIPFQPWHTTGIGR